ncbi:MAG: ATP-dependent helicase, partial [Deltaproteobacteria bacterium]|nr:ATP-dependent helicase [Deltaproteobacteria bacterium]
MALDLSTLNPAQRAAVTAPDGPMLIIAGAGSGKTRTIVHRLAWLHERGVPPEAMLLLTFTRKAATEMLERAARLLGHKLHQVQGGTFHGFAYSVLRHTPPIWAGGPVTIMDTADSAAAMQQCKEALQIGRGDRSFPRVQSVLALLSKARNKEIGISEMLGRESPHLLAHADDLERLAAAYAAWRREHALLDYDDLLFELEYLLRTRPELTGDLRERFRYIMVDEYQDTNRAQARLTRLLAGEQGNVMAVGDDAQSIYAFRGADVRNILDFQTLFKNTRIIRLEENYRSTQPVLDIANAVLAHSHEAFAKRLFTTKQGGERVRLVRPLSDLRQADLVADRLDALLETCRAPEIAVLFRAGYQSYHLEVALAKRGIRFRKYGGLRYAEAAHIKDVLAFVRLLINPLDMPSLERVAALCKGVGPKTARKIFALLRTGDADGLRKACAKHLDLAADLALLDDLRATPPPPADLLTRIIDQYRPRLETMHPEDWPRRLQGLDELRHIASSYTEVDRFVADLSLETPDEEADEADAVVLSTIHSAKG